MFNKEDFPKQEKEKTREELFEDLISSLEKQGVPIIRHEKIEEGEEGVELRIEDEKLIIEQEYGKERINGLGRDKKEKSNWTCLNQKWIELTGKQKEIAEREGVDIKEVEGEEGTKKCFSKFVKENRKFDSNQVLALGIDFPGIEIGKVEGKENIVKIRILPDHPVTALAKLLGKMDKVDLRGGFNNWCEEEKNERKNGKEIKGNLKEVDGWLECEIKWDGEPVQCKIAILDIEGSWDENKWADGPQKMEIDLEKENKGE
ncbi:MAG: hypothetical protein KAQ64_04330 [Candidatus Pacebacteria bacterium]|nr:hypothetical protein [Candidatus Paceibacterota bacterium]